MSIQLVNPTMVKVRKVWSTKEEDGESYCNVAEIEIIDPDTIREMIAVLAKAEPFGPDDFYPPAKIGYGVLFIDDGEEKGLTVDGDLIRYDSRDGEDEKEDAALLPIGESLMWNLLDPLFQGVEPSKQSYTEIWLELEEQRKTR